MRIFILLLLYVTQFLYADQELHVVFDNSNIQYNPIYAVSSEEAQLFTALHEGLVSVHPQYLYPVPALAKSWKIDETQTIYTFKLRDNIYFSNGEKIRAQHFVRSWMQQLKAGDQALFSSMFDVIQGAKEYRNTGKGSVGIKALSDNLLQIILKHPTPHFLKLITHHSFTLIHPSLLTETDWSHSSKLIVTSGPFTIESFKNDSIVLVPNKYYWDTISLSKITITFAQDFIKQQLTQLFNQNKVDWILSAAIDAKTLENKSSIIISPSFSSTFLFFRVDKNPWDNPKVRIALAMLLPWQIIRSTTLLPRAANTLVPTIDSYPVPKSIKNQDRKKALTLLKEAGFSKDHLLPAIRIILPQTMVSEDMNLANILQGSWESITEKVEIISVHEEILIPTLHQKTYTVGTLLWIGDYTDPLAFLEFWLPDSELNFSHYDKQQYTEQIQRSMQISDLSKRYKLLSQAESLLLENAVVLPLSHGTSINIINTTRIKGWYPNPLDIHPFKALSINNNANLLDLVTLR